MKGKRKTGDLGRKRRTGFNAEQTKRLATLHKAFVPRIVRAEQIRPETRNKILKILDIIAETGGNVRNILTDNKMSALNFYAAVLTDKELIPLYRKATKIKLEVIADELIHIADNCPETKEGVAKAALRIKTRLQVLSHLDPMHWGMANNRNPDSVKKDNTLTVYFGGFSATNDNQPTLTPKEPTPINVPAEVVGRAVSTMDKPEITQSLDGPADKLKKVKDKLDRDKEVGSAVEKDLDANDYNTINIEEDISDAEVVD